jgi:hypothetical protein
VQDADDFDAIVDRFVKDHVIPEGRLFPPGALGSWAARRHGMLSFNFPARVGFDFLHVERFGVALFRFPQPNIQFGPQVGQSLFIFGTMVVLALD